MSIPALRLMPTAETLMGAPLSHTHANITPADVNTLKPEFPTNGRIYLNDLGDRRWATHSPASRYMIRLNLPISGPSFLTCCTRPNIQSNKVENWGFRLQPLVPEMGLRHRLATVVDHLRFVWLGTPTITQRSQQMT